MGSTTTGWTAAVRSALVRACSGPCPGCLALRRAPLCEACRAASAVRGRPWLDHADGIALLFVGTWHAGPGVPGSARSPLGRALRAFKDHGNRHAGRCLSRLFAEVLAATRLELDVLAPVPPEQSRLRARGLHAPGWMARRLGAATGLPVRHDLLRRAAATAPQRGLGARGRRENLRGAFAAGPALAAGLRVGIVDDVLTSGSTIAEAVRCVRAAGATPAAALVLACADEQKASSCRSRTASAGSRATGNAPVPHHDRP